MGRGVIRRSDSSARTLPLPKGRYPLAELIASSEVVCLQNLFEDGWMREQVNLSFRVVSGGELTLHGIFHSSDPTQAMLTVPGESPKIFSIQR